MEAEAAIKLISHPSWHTDKPQKWADLGCGSGTFTLALASLLADGSHIVAIDTSASAIRSIPDEYTGVSIETHCLDFVKDKLPLADLDGILMANALHYVKDKESFINSLRPYFKTGTMQMLVVEYDTDSSNAWVPFPLSFAKLEALMNAIGFQKPIKINTAVSRYQNAGMYGALCQMV